MKSNTFQATKLTIGSRVFQIRALRFDNGCFLSICEGDSERMGGLTVALRLTDKVEVINPIPYRQGSISASLIAETAAVASKGITILSFYVLSDIDRETLQTLQREIKSLLS